MSQTTNVGAGFNITEVKFLQISAAASKSTSMSPACHDLHEPPCLNLLLPGGANPAEHTDSGFVNANAIHAD